MGITSNLEGMDLEMTRNQKTKPVTSKETPAILPENIRELVEMHQYMRPSGGKTEVAFCLKYLDTLPGVYTDEAGNRIGIIGDNPTVLWSSHTDTVHKADGMQQLEWGDNLLSLHDQADKVANCLGADCTVGVWLMRQMYLAKKSGLYIWHADEEAGGGGSTYVAEKTPELLSGINYAIALDRKGINSVITHQFFGRCASNGFADAFAAVLGKEWVADSHGTFTDTANYTHLVPECTNISVGYYDQHTPYETLDTAHAASLLGKLLALDVDSLPVSRDPTYQEPMSTSYTSSDYYKYSSKYAPSTLPTEVEDMLDVIWDHKIDLAKLLLEYGFTPAELLEEFATRNEATVQKKGGTIHRLYAGPA